MKSVLHAKKSTRELSRTNGGRTALGSSKPKSNSTNRVFQKSGTSDVANVTQPDELMLAARGPYWLRASWNQLARGRKRAEAALRGEWFRSKFVLRLVDLTAEEETNKQIQLLRQIELPAGVRQWYFEVPGASRRYCAEIGFATDRGRFVLVARSKEFEANPPAVVHASKSRPVNLPHRNGVKKSVGGKSRPTKSPHELDLTLEAELVLRGRATPGSKVTIQDVPIRLKDDGRFAVRYMLDEGRHVIPTMARTLDGLKRRLIVLGIERNTRFVETDEFAEDE